MNNYFRKFLEKNIKIIENFESKKKIKKIILFASHKFSESPHARGKLIFQDFYEHFKQTLKKKDFLNDIYFKQIKKKINQIYDN